MRRTLFTLAAVALTVTMALAGPAAQATGTAPRSAGAPSPGASGLAALAPLLGGFTGGLTNGDVRAVVRSGTFQSWSAQHPPVAVTYNRTLVGRAAHAFVAAVTGPRTGILLVVTGLRANRAYGAHVHTQPCGATGAAAGRHYQNWIDPHQPSVNPSYANPDNEIWLDFTTDRTGFGWSARLAGWPVRAGRAGSVVIHERHTSHTPGAAGTAGARVACITVPI
jgi:Cu-Zn family superoxide dismutase